MRRPSVGTPKFVRHMWVRLPACYSRREPDEIVLHGRWWGCLRCRLAVNERREPRRDERGHSGPCGISAIRDVMRS